MAKKIYSEKKHTPKCEYCIHGRPSPNSDSILCEKKGIVDRDDKCRSYKYDPLRRVPRQAPKLPENDASDFEL